MSTFSPAQMSMDGLGFRQSDNRLPHHDVLELCEPLDNPATLLLHRERLNDPIRNGRAQVPIGAVQPLDLDSRQRQFSCVLRPIRQSRCT